MTVLKRLLLASVFLPSMGFAQSVTLDVAGDNEALVAALKSASLSLALDPQDAPNSQDYIAAARADYRRLLTALYGQGHYSGVISILVDGREAAQIAPLDAPARISNVTLNVSPGPVFSFGQTQLAPIPQNTVLPEEFSSGARANASVISQAVSDGVDAWRAAGHAKAAPSGQKVTARHAQEQLDVSIALSPGPKLTFGDLEVTGNTAVSTPSILRIAGLPTGETYSPAEIKKAESRLRKTGAFDSVAATEAKTANADDSLPIVMQVVESKPRRFGFGLELSSIEGLKVSSYWMHRNFLGGAERFRVDAEVSGIGGATGGVDYALGLNFERPAIYGPDTNFFLRSEISRDDEPDYLIDRASLEAGATRVINDDLTTSVGLGFLTAREVTQQGTRQYTLLTAPLSATLDRRDDPTNAKAGYFLNLDATPFYDTTNDVFGTRMFADARAYRSFGQDAKTTLAGRIQIGSVAGTTIANAPADFLFYSGGGGSVRGQSYKSLGIDSTAGGVTTRTGGRSFVGAQLEARYAVTDKIGVVGFYDFGRVSADDGFAGQTDWHAGAGIGLRYNTGIGPIRLDLGTPASGDNIGKNLEVYIGIGQSF